MVGTHIYEVNYGKANYIIFDEPNPSLSFTPLRISIESLFHVSPESFTWKCQYHLRYILIIAFIASVARLVLYCVLVYILTCIFDRLNVIFFCYSHCS